MPFAGGKFVAFLARKKKPLHTSFFRRAPLYPSFWRCFQAELDTIKYHAVHMHTRLLAVNCLILACILEERIRLLGFDVLKKLILFRILFLFRLLFTFFPCVEEFVF